MGLPGSGLGGMDPHGGGGSFLSRPYGIWPDADAKPPEASAMERVPIQVWATKSFTGRWHEDAENVPHAELSVEQQDLLGSVTNPYEFSLENCLIAYDRWVYKLGTIAPGKTCDLSTRPERVDLKNFLTGFHMGEGKDAAAQVTTFEMYNRDPSYILRAMMFYEAAGGWKYAHLSNDYQSFVDLSDLLRAGRAILWADAVRNANATKQGAILLRDGKPLARNQDRHDVIYRFVFPVKKK